MNDILLFLLNSTLFGVGLAMDAFSVSAANGLREPKMSTKKELGISSVFSAFQTAMPLIGWLCIHTIATAFTGFQKFIPWIALILLSFIGIKMLIEGFGNSTDEPDETKPTGFIALLIQGIATSIDALSVGFTIADMRFFMALIESLIIGVVTFIICLCGVKIGKKFGMMLKGKANIIGGIILIGIGLEIFITNLINK